MNYRRGVVYLILAASLFICGGQAWGALGDPLWEKTINYTGYDTTMPYALAATSNTLIVCGTASIQSTFTNSIGFIRAYDIVTGNIKWQGTSLTLASTQDANNHNTFLTIRTNGNIAMVLGTAMSESDGYPGTIYLNKTILRAYVADTGQLLWENIKDGNAVYPGPIMLTTNNLVFITGTDTPYGLPPSIAWVRAYQVPNTGLQSPLLLLDDQ